MTDIRAHFTNNSVPLVTPAVAPTITIRRNDTQAIVVAASNMTEIGDGNFIFAFAPLASLEYSIRADGDPTAVNQVTPAERYQFGSLSGVAEAQLALIANLDATISSRATQASVDAIQNNTRFVAIVPPILKLPTAGTKDYRFFGRLFDTAGSPEDPDANTMSLRIETVAGAILVATVAMTRTGIGLYQFDYTVNFNDTEQPLNVFFEYAENAAAFQHVRVTEVSEFESRLDIIQNAVVTDIPAQISALNDLSVGDILTAILGSGNTVDAELSAMLLMRDFLEGGREIDFVGNDALGWQRIERDVGGTLLRRYNLFDEAGARINETVASFIARQGMISAEVAI